jgi:hypothetical protein
MRDKMEVVETETIVGMFYEVLSEFKGMNFLEIVGMITLTVLGLGALYVLYCFLWILAH